MGNKIILNIIVTLVAFLVIPLFSLSQNQNKSKLEYLVKLPKNNSEKPPLLILLHGYGSNERDMFNISSRIPENWLVVSVRGYNSHGNNNYSWYDAKIIDGTISINFKEEEESRKEILQLIEDLTNYYNVNKKRVVVAGFSQGANMAQCVCLTEPDNVSGFACFSGRYIEEITPLISKSPSLKLLQAFIAHGSEDNLLPIKHAKENINILESLSISTIFSEDKTAHTISEFQLNEFVTWLNRF